MHYTRVQCLLRHKEGHRTHSTNVPVGRPGHRNESIAVFGRAAVHSALPLVGSETVRYFELKKANHCPAQWMDLSCNYDEVQTTIFLYHVDKSCNYKTCYQTTPPISKSNNFLNIICSLNCNPAGIRRFEYKL